MRISDAYVAVYGTGSADKDLGKAGQNLALRLSARVRRFADVELPEKLLESHNLILVGTPESNSEYVG
jgi:hypothetical protein